MEGEFCVIQREKMLFDLGNLIDLLGEVCGRNGEREKRELWKLFLTKHRNHQMNNTVFSLFHNIFFCFCVIGGRYFVLYITLFLVKEKKENKKCYSKVEKKILRKKYFVLLKKQIRRTKKCY